MPLIQDFLAMLHRAALEKSFQQQVSQLISDIVTYIQDHLFLAIPLKNWAIALGIMLAAFLLKRLFARVMQFLLGHWRWRGRELGKHIADATLPALQLMIIATGFEIATSPSILKFSKSINTILNHVSSTLTVVVVCLLIQGVGQAMVTASQQLAVSNGKQPSAVINSFYKKAITVGTVILGVFMILRVWGFDISSLLAGLGIGGLALSLAAQDTFSNLLGGITIMTDRAFEIGDVISTPEVEGTVEEIGFRSTKVRTYSQAQVNIPNAKLSNAYVTNLSRIGKRRIRFTLNVPYTVDPALLRLLIARLETVVSQREAIMADGTLIFLEKYGPNAQEVLFQCFVNRVDYGEFMAEQQAVLFDVRRILNELDIPIALDTMHVHLVSGNRQQITQVQPLD